MTLNVSVSRNLRETNLIHFYETLLCPSCSSFLDWLSNFPLDSRLFLSYRVKSSLALEAKRQAHRKSAFGVGSKHNLRYDDLIPSSRLEYTWLLERKGNFNQRYIILMKSNCWVKKKRKISFAIDKKYFIWLSVLIYCGHEKIFARVHIFQWTVFLSAFIFQIKSFRSHCITAICG